MGSMLRIYQYPVASRGFLWVATISLLFSASPNWAAETTERDQEFTRWELLYGKDLVGQALPDWADLRFLDSPHKRDREDFEGKALIVRFWTAGCSLCLGSAPTLSEWAEEYEEKGLVIIGVYHPKPPRRVSDKEVRELASSIKMDLLLAVDDDWSVLDKLWMQGERRAYTSSAILVDPSGTIRATHRGGTLSPEGTEAEVAEYKAFSDSLQIVLGEMKKSKSP